jgi:hypothetical protein
MTPFKTLWKIIALTWGKWRVFRKDNPFPVWENLLCLTFAIKWVGTSEALRRMPVDGSGWSGADIADFMNLSWVWILLPLWLPWGSVVLNCFGEAVKELYPSSPAE